MKKTISLLLILQILFSANTMAQQTKMLAAGVETISFGKADKFTPYYFCDTVHNNTAISALPQSKLPFNINDIKIQVTERGCIVEIPLNDEEQLYGFGLQVNSFNQRGLRKQAIVNDNPLNDLGYTHAPLPYYVSTAGYGILINTARYTTFYCGTTNKLKNETNDTSQVKKATSTEELYKTSNDTKGYVTVDIPGAKGIEVFVFGGPDMKTAVQRYNLFSGGGTLPPLWSLGVKYRVKADFNDEQVYKMADYFRRKEIPCDVIGLEPQWQTAAYSCSYVWNNKLFPQPQTLIDNLKKQQFHINLWEHAFVAKQSPLYEPLKNQSGNYLVWNGLVPDFASNATRKRFGDYHKTTFADKGIAAFKLDECDNSNIAYGSGAWSFPELSRFPSGIDGEQMHQLFGLLYQKTMLDIYKQKNQRTMLDVRSSNAFTSSNTASLYSDTYDHKGYIQMIVNAGFSGLLWSPEVRESKTVTELLRRTQTAVLSAQTLFNSWYLQNPPWLQIDKEKNNRNELMPEAKETEQSVKQLLDMRMSLVPYLYNAFAQYKFTGLPPFRALVMDYPTDKNTFNLSNEYMIGESILAVPLTGESSERKVYLPAGVWYDFNDNKKYEGGKEYTITNSTTQLPIFIRSGTILPLAKPLAYVSSDAVFEITCKIYGDAVQPATLFEDDGVSFDYEKSMYNILTVSWNKGKGFVQRKGTFKKSMYRIVGWEKID